MNSTEYDFYKLTLNAAACNRCQTYIESTHRHDYKSCKCGAISVDGGLEYVRRSYRHKGDIEEMSEYRKLTKEELIAKIAYFEDMNFKYSNSWTEQVETGKRLLKEWYPE